MEYLFNQNITNFQQQYSTDKLRNNLNRPLHKVVDAADVYGLPTSGTLF